MAKKSGTLVRSSDGKLYLVNPTGLSTILPDDQQKAVEAALPKLQQQMEAIMAQDATMAAAGCNQHVQIIIPDIKVS
jgi:hypothetical protein